MATVAAQGLTPAGPWYTHHFRMRPDIFDFEIGGPLTIPIQPTGRVQVGQWPAITLARTRYHGSSDGLGAAWGEFEAWLAAEGHTTGPDLWEQYVVGPESNPDPSHWRTELSRPLA